MRFSLKEILIELVAKDHDKCLPTLTTKQIKPSQICLNQGVALTNSSNNNRTTELAIFLRPTLANLVAFSLTMTNRGHSISPKDQTTPPTSPRRDPANKRSLERPLLQITQMVLTSRRLVTACNFSRTPTSIRRRWVMAALSQ